MNSENLDLKYSNHIIAFFATLACMSLLFLLLWFVYVDAPQLNEEAGIEVVFGDAVDGGGELAPQAEEVEASAQTQVLQNVPTPNTPSANEFLTQEDDESLVLQREQEKVKKEERLRAEQERQRQLALQQEARKAEEARRAAEEAAAKKAAEEKAKRDKAANAMAGMFGNAGTSTVGGAEDKGMGTTSNSTVQGSELGTKGNPVGSGSSGGNSWALTGRMLKGGLSQPNIASLSQEGVVVVNIRVNAAGQVIGATRGQGTTISDEATIQAACAAAKLAQFSEGDGDVVGKITYVFKQK